MQKDKLEIYLKQGLSTRQIEKLEDVTITRNTISYYIHKYGLKEDMYYKKPEYNENYFSKIDTKEKAYILGYLLADAYFHINTLEFGCMLSDKELLDFIAKEIGGQVRIDDTYVKSKKRFPRARLNYNSKIMYKDLLHLIKEHSDKRMPRISKDLESYMVLGFFDGDGCITWGKRKDRNRIWHKISFTGSYKLLYTVQQILLKLDIASSLTPKSGENCYVLQFADRKNVLKFLDYIYKDNSFIVLNRKFLKSSALRLELDEFGENFIK